MFEAWRDGMKGTAMAIQLSYERAAPKSIDSIIDKRRLARSVWRGLTPVEQAAVTELHILETDMKQRDARIFANRVRIARSRFAA